MSDIKKCFISRFPDGVLLEIDYSQLEIYVLAYLSNDPQLKLDLLSGVDLHGISAERLFGKGYTDAQRRIAKSLSFQLQYGAGYKSMAEQNDISETLAKKFIKLYYERYPMVKQFQDEVASIVRSTRITDPDLRTKTGIPAGMGFYKAETGRFYVFTEKDSPDWMTRATSFSPTEMKNYPVQGFATGDIVPMILGKLHRGLSNWHGGKEPPIVVMINTVHDSVLFDCSSESIAKIWYQDAKVIMESAPRYLKEHFNINFDLPLKVDAKVGKNWGEMEKLDI